MSHQFDPAHHESNAARPSTARPPRAFAQGTGVLLQMVGGILILTSGCVCSSAFLWDPQWSRLEAEVTMRPGSAEESWSARLIEEPAKFGFMLMVVFTSVGGLALVVFGFGLQTEKPGSAWAALVADVLLLAVLVLAGVGLWRGAFAGQTSVFGLIWHGAVTLVVIGLLGFVVPALRQVLADPPSGKLNVVPKDFDPRKDLGPKP